MKSIPRSVVVFAEGVALLVGTIVGAGFLVLPYAALRSGIFFAAFWFLVFSLLVTVLHLMYADIVAHTDSIHRLPGYAEMYLGPIGGSASLLTFIAGIFGGLLVYLLLGGHFLYLLAGSILGVSPLLATVLFWFLLSLLILVNVKLSGRVNLILNIALVVLFLALVAAAFSRFDPANLSLPIGDPPFFAYGIVLFSLVGYLAIPEIFNLLKAEGRAPRAIKPIVIGGTLIAAALSFLFMISILGATGPATSNDAISGLAPLFPKAVVAAAAMVVFLALATSYLIFGISIRNTLVSDIHFSPHLASFLVAAVPFFFVLLGVRDFVRIIAFLGSAWVSIDALLIILIYLVLPPRAAPLFRAPRWLLGGAVLFIVAGAIISLMYT